MLLAWGEAWPSAQGVCDTGFCMSQGTTIPVCSGTFEVLMDVPLWQSLEHICLDAICLGSLRVDRKLIFSYSRKQPPSAMSRVTLLPCVQSMLRPLRITLLLSEQEKKGLTGWSRAWVKKGSKKCKAIKTSVYSFDNLAGRRNVVQWSGMYFPRSHEGPDERESSVFAELCRRMGAVLNLTLAAGSLNFRETNRIPSVCAFAESHHHLAPSFWEQ